MATGFGTPGSASPALSQIPQPERQRGTSAAFMRGVLTAIPLARRGSGRRRSVTNENIVGLPFILVR